MPRPTPGDEESARGVPRRAVVDSVGDEPAILPHRRPGEYAHVGITEAGREQGLIPPLHVGRRVRPARNQGIDVDPHDPLVADRGHHLTDEGAQPNVGTDVDVGRVVGSERDHPASPVRAMTLILGQPVAVGRPARRLDDRGGEG